MQYVDKVKQIEQLLIGKSVVEVVAKVSYPGQVNSLLIVFTDGMKITLNANLGGCSECDPDGSGYGMAITAYRNCGEVVDI